MIDNNSYYRHRSDDLLRDYSAEFYGCKLVPFYKIGSLKVGSEELNFH